MHKIVLVLSPNIQLWVAFNEICEVVVGKDPLGVGVLAGDWVLKAVGFEVLLEGFCLYGIATWEDQRGIHYFLSLTINT